MLMDLDVDEVDDGTAWSAENFPEFDKWLCAGGETHVSGGTRGALRNNLGASRCPANEQDDYVIHLD